MFAGERWFAGRVQCQAVDTGAGAEADGQRIGDVAQSGIEVA